MAGSDHPARLRRKLVHAHVNAPLWLFIFWVIQFVGWTLMIFYVQFFNPRLGQNVLYVTQISHWALVEAAGTAAIASWGLLQAQHNSRQIRQVHEDIDPKGETPLH